jgi:type II secretory pathway pseudopilin PulG
MAFLIVIIGILTVNLLKPLSASIKNRQIEYTQNVLEEAKRALVGYATLNNILPCPDTDYPSDGIPNSPCTNSEEGYLPWQELGINGQDAWGSYVRYRPDQNFTSGIFPITSDNLKIRNIAGLELSKPDEMDLDNNGSDEEYSRVAVILFSCGKNTIPDNGNGYFSSALSKCRNSNTPDATYVSDDLTDSFDDILTWIPRNVLINRLVNSNQWTP